MSEHISESDLLLGFDGELTPEQDEAVRLHRQACPHCEQRWLSLADTSRDVQAIQCPDVKFRPEEFAVAALAARFDHVPRAKAHWSRLVWANTLAAVAVAVTCMVALPAWHSHTHPAPHPAGNYDVDDSVPAGYVSLPYADPSLPVEDGAVLPVELSAEDLELMGMDAGGREAVKAEILLGVDGWPRAIRIIDQE